MKLIIGFCYTFLIVSGSCNDKMESKEKKRINNNYIETIFINDTTFHGLTKYYSLGDTLEAEIEFVHGVKHGFSKNYYPNGRTYDSVNFINGFRQGFHYVYDSTGDLVYKDFFFNGMQVGSLYYYEGGRLNEYDFISLEGEPLYKAIYDDTGTIKEFGGEIITAVASAKFVNGKETNSILLYLIDPPTVSIEYSIYICDSASKDRKLVKKINESKDMFVDFDLPVLKQQEGYYIQADYSDSLNSFRKVYIRAVQF